MPLYEVHLEGTWKRPNSWIVREDLAFYTDQIRRALRTGQLRTDMEWSGAGLAEGTYTLDIDVSARNSNEAMKEAKRLLVAACKESMCRAPSIRVL